MFLSMTGFANKTVSLALNKAEKVSVLIEMKSINSRFFEVACKLPSVLNSLEVTVIRKLKEKLLRGRIYLTIKFFEEEALLQTISPNLSVVGEYVKAINEIKDKFSLSGNLNVSDFLNLQGIFVIQKSQVGDNFEKLVVDSIMQVADLLVKSRAKEGKSLQKDLDMRFKMCSEKIIVIKDLFKKFMQKKKNEIKKVSASYHKGDEQVKMKLDELYSVLNKIDIHEEITRFDSHLKNVRNIIKDNGTEKGKRLDFVLQELMRESNTMLAKCSEFNISSAAVDIKVELEKAREQVQNIV